MKYNGGNVGYVNSGNGTRSNGYHPYPKMSKILKKTFIQPKLSFKKAPSNTKTKTKSSLKGKVLPDNTNGGTFSYHTYGKYKKIRAIDKKNQLIQTYRMHKTQRISTSVGRQALSIGCLYHANPIDYNFMYSNKFTSIGATAANTTQVTKNLYTVNPLYNKLETKILNQSSTAVEIVLYDYVVRLDEETTISPEGDWTYLDEYVYGTTIVNTNPGQTPYSSTAFCRKYRITKSYKFFLSSGSVHVHTIFQNMNKKYTGQSLFDQPGGLKGRTGGTMIVVLGGMGNDATNKTQISYNACAVDVIQTLHMVGFSNPDTGKANQFATASLLPQAFTVGPSVMEEMNQAIDTMTNA